MKYHCDFCDGLTELRFWRSFLRGTCIPPRICFQQQTTQFTVGTNVFPLYEFTINTTQDAGFKGCARWQTHRRAQTSGFSLSHIFSQGCSNKTAAIGGALDAVSLTLHAIICSLIIKGSDTSQVFRHKTYANYCTRDSTVSTIFSRITLPGHSKEQDSFVLTSGCMTVFLFFFFLWNVS